MNVGLFLTQSRIWEKEWSMEINPDKCEVLRIHRKKTIYLPISSVETGVRQGCILSPNIFLIVVDWVMKQATLAHIRQENWNPVDPHGPTRGP